MISNRHLLSKHKWCNKDNCNNSYRLRLSSANSPVNLKNNFSYFNNNNSFNSNKVLCRHSRTDTSKKWQLANYNNRQWSACHASCNQTKDNHKRTNLQINSSSLRKKEGNKLQVRIHRLTGMGVLVFCIRLTMLNCKNRCFYRRLKICLRGHKVKLNRLREKLTQVKINRGGKYLKLLSCKCWNSLILRLNNNNSSKNLFFLIVDHYKRSSSRQLSKNLARNWRLTTSYKWVSNSRECSKSQCLEIGAHSSFWWCNSSSKEVRKSVLKPLLNSQKSHSARSNHECKGNPSINRSWKS